MLFLLVFACASSGSDSGDTVGAHGHLTQQEVTEVPPGDAQGEAWTSSYDAEVRTLTCTGTCGTGASSMLPASFCDVGDLDYEVFYFAQDDGLLEMEVSDPISYYRGGVDADGTLVMGGYATDLGGAVELLALVEGRFTGELLEGSATASILGTVDGQPIDCVGTYSVEAVRSDW